MVRQRPANVFATNHKAEFAIDRGPYQVRCRLCGWTSGLFDEYWDADDEMCVHNRSHWAKSLGTWVVEPQLLADYDPST